MTNMFYIEIEEKVAFITRNEVTFLVRFLSVVCVFSGISIYLSFFFLATGPI